MIARTYDMGIAALQYCGPWDTLYLDHDLGEPFYDEIGRRRNGVDVMKWILENPQFAPKEIVCVSANPVGRKNIEGYIKDLGGIRNE